MQRAANRRRILALLLPRATLVAWTPVSCPCPPTAPSPASTQHSTVTLGTVARLNRLLLLLLLLAPRIRLLPPSTVTVAGYTTGPPAYYIILLRLFSDASYLSRSRPNAGCVSGSFHYLSRYDTPTFINASISYLISHAAPAAFPLL
jgi:hypothetical protein